MLPKYSHLIYVDEPSRKVIIHRVHSDGRRELFTEALLPLTHGADGFAEFCRMLGENVLLDSPATRKLLGL